ncbi:tetraacyldisaccharide 4'-kinase [Brackiella oedipodis]|uniref:tetraacyldisaccharide 4'-kinase n=1 Tax=Brackiella oedipodis TaxID=124225 RepID=UPI00048E72D2|nr:tetraacyldisaccharide 4'-kinase [Brackiella oedipodis]
MKKTSGQPSRHDFVQQQWQHKTCLSTCLLPFAWLYMSIQGLRRKLYDWGLKSSYRAPCPVIVVGNIYVGGTGKTPTVVALVKALQARGWQPAIISRGYGVKLGAHARSAYQQSARPECIGDEPSLLAQYAPIAVHPDRKKAIRQVFQDYPHTNVIIADDGLQHLAMQRDLELVIQDERGIGNGRVLPAGPLRESKQRLQDVDFVITNKNHLSSHPSPNAVSSRATKPLHLTMHIQIDEIVHLVTGRRLPVSQWLQEYGHSASDLCAIAAIGNPQRFFSSLKEAGISAAEQRYFADHHVFNQEELQQIPQSLIVMTEKDAVKCAQFNDPRLWFVRISSQFSRSDFFDIVENKLNTHQKEA